MHTIIPLSDCEYHFRLSAPECIDSFLDAGSFVATDMEMQSNDPLHLADLARPYAQRLAEGHSR